MFYILIYWSCLLCYLAISMRGGSQQWIGIDHVLMYHMVRDHINGAKFNKLRVKPAEFEKQSCLDESARLPFCNDARIARELGKHPAKTVATHTLMMVI